MEKVIPNTYEISEIKLSYDEQTGIYTETIIMNPLARISDESGLRKKVLNILIKELLNYKNRKEI
jgi:hypothetical protein